MPIRADALIEAIIHAMAGSETRAGATNEAGARFG